MCRIWGISYAPDAQEHIGPSELAIEIFPDLVTGGPDAWGYATWDGYSIQSAKFQGKANKKKAKQRMKGIDDDALWVMGHTRAETHGSSNYEYNNHPIVHGDVIGVHNGLITNHEEVLRATGRQNEEALVDSEAIFAAVNLLGYSGLNLVEGTMVTVWANRNKPAEVWIARSRTSELYIAHTVNGSTVWCTEKQPLSDCSLDLEEEPEKISRTGIAYRVISGALSDPFVYNPDIRDTGTGFSTGNYGSRGYNYQGNQTQTQKMTYIPKLSPGRNPAGLIRRAKIAAQQNNPKTDQERASVNTLKAIGELEDDEDTIPLSGITDYFESGKKESRKALPTQS